MDQECFVLRKTNVKQVIIIKKEWNQFTCYTAEGENIFTEYRPYMHTNRPIPWEEIFEDWEKKPRVIRYSRFFKYLPQRVQDYLLFHKDERKACVTGLKYLIQKYSLQRLHLLLENEEWLKSSARTRYHIANEASNVSTKMERKPYATCFDRLRNRSSAI